MLKETAKSVRKKVVSLFKTLGRDQARRLRGDWLPENLVQLIAQSLAGPGASESEFDDATVIAYQVVRDEDPDVAFLVALRFFPERFSPAEIQAGVHSVLKLPPMKDFVPAPIPESSSDEDNDECSIFPDDATHYA